MNAQPATQKKSFMDKMMHGIEAATKSLPPPFFMFLWLFAIVAVVAVIVDMAGVVLVNPATGKEVVANNLFTRNGVVWFLKSMVTNYTGYAPLGLVLVMTMGIGLCEESGLINVLIRRAMANIPPAMVPYATAIIGVCGNAASDSAAVILPPVAAMVYLSVNKNPMLGMMVVYSGNNMGHSANLIIAGTDALLAGITNAQTEALIPGFVVEVTCNYYFLFVSTFVVGVTVAFASEKIVAPAFPPLDPDHRARVQGSQEEITAQQKKAMGIAGLAALAYVAIIVAGLMTGFLLNDEGGITGSPFLTGLIPILFGLFTTAGVVYGIAAGTIKSDKDISAMLTRRIATMSSYMVTVFATGQFNALFNWSNLGTMLAISGADFLGNAGISGIPMFLAFMLFNSTINILIGSASAKWSILAPIFVPMFMLMGYHPSAIQQAYRVSDSCTNAVTPLSVYLYMMIDICETKYEMKGLNVGKMLSGLWPMSFCVLVVWYTFFVIWTMLGIPYGLGGQLYLGAEQCAQLGITPIG